MWLSLCGALWLAACASPPATPPAWSEQAGRLRQLPAVATPDAAVGGLAAPVADGHLASGDHLEFDIVLQRGGRLRSWRLSVEVTAVEARDVLDLRAHLPFEERVQPGAERRARIEAEQRAFVEHMRRGQAGIDELFAPRAVATLRVQAFDADGELVGTGESDALTTLLERGLVASCEAGFRQREPMRGRVAAGLDAPMLTLDDAGFDDVNVAATGFAACERFFRILQENPVTRSILLEVLALPSLWSIVTNWGVKVGFAVDFFAAEPVDPALFPEAGRALWSVPMTVLLNDQPGMLAHLVVGPAGAPDGAAAGVYAVVARHPDDAERVAVVRLRASRRAAVPVSEPGR